MVTQMGMTRRQFVTTVAGAAAAVRAWFAAYVNWMATSKNGTNEEHEKNDHGTYWVLQVAEFSQFAKRADLTALCVDHFKNTIVPGQIAKDGVCRWNSRGRSLIATDCLIWMY